MLWALCYCVLGVAFHYDIERYGKSKLLLAPTISHYLCFCSYLILRNQCRRSLGMLVAWQRTVNSCISVATRWYSSASLGKLWFGLEGRNRMSLRIVWYFIIFICNRCRPLLHILQAPYLHLILCSATLCSRQCRRCRRCNALSVTLSVTQRSSKITHSTSLNHSFIDLLL